MKRIEQPPDSHLCGQAVVAMIAGLTLDDACEWVGKCGLTSGVDLRRAFERLGYAVDKVEGLDGTGFGRLRCPALGADWSHWFAFDRGVIYDPAFPGGYNDWPAGRKITSLFRVTPMGSPARLTQDME